MRTFQHIKKGGTYKVIGKVMVKVDGFTTTGVLTRTWEKGFIYSAVVGEALERQLYVRTEKDFRERFVEIRLSINEQRLKLDVCPKCNNIKGTIQGRARNGMADFRCSKGHTWTAREAREDHGKQ